MPELTVEPEKADGITEAEATQDDSADVLLEDDLLVEDVSIDGMCGVY